MTTFNKIAYFRHLPPETMKELSATALRVLIKLYDHTNADGMNAHPGVAKLAEECGVAESSVKAGLKTLVKAGCIERYKPGGRSGDGSHWAAKYRLLIPASASKESDLEEESQGPETDASGSESTPPQGPKVPISGSESADPQGPEMLSQGPENRPLTNHVLTNHVTNPCEQTTDQTSPTSAGSSVDEFYTCAVCDRDFSGAPHSSDGLCGMCGLEAQEPPYFVRRGA